MCSPYCWMLDKDKLCIHETTDMSLSYWLNITFLDSSLALSNLAHSSDETAIANFTWSEVIANGSLIIFHLFLCSLQLIVKYLKHTVCKCQYKPLLTLDSIFRYYIAFASNTLNRAFQGPRSIHQSNFSKSNWSTCRTSFVFGVEAGEKNGTYYN